MGFERSWEPKPHPDAARDGFVSLEDAVRREGRCGTFQPLLAPSKAQRPQGSLPTVPPQPTPQPQPALDPEPAPQPERHVDDLHEDLSDAALLRARDEAREVGRQAGLTEGREELARRLAAVEDMALQLAGLREELFAHSVQDIADAALRIVEEVLRRELAQGGIDIEALVRSVLDEARDADEIVLRLSPVDDQMIQDAYPGLLSSLGRERSFHIEIDDSLDAGGCIVETNHGIINASLATRLQGYVDAVLTWADDEVRNHAS